MEFTLGEQIMLGVTMVGSVTAAAVGVFTFYEKIKLAKKPHEDRVQMIQEHDRKLENDYQVIKEMQTEQRILLQNDLLIMEHIINGNHIHKLQEQRDFIHRYLIEKS